MLGIIFQGKERKCYTHVPENVVFKWHSIVMLHLNSYLGFTVYRFVVYGCVKDTCMTCK